MIRGTSAAIATFALLLAATPSAAQSNDVAGWIELIAKQPDAVERTDWKSQRRDAARKLAASRDKRAVPVLIQLAESESFDIIGEIAIDGLGAIGDRAAIAPLQRIAADDTRDSAQRVLARKALAKLGGAERTPEENTDSGELAVTTSGSIATITPGLGAEAATAPTSEQGTADVSAAGEAVELPDDALAAYERITMAAGSATIGYDTLRGESSFNGDVAGRYQRRLERPSFAWGVDAGARVVAGMFNPDDARAARGALVNADGVGEARLYRGGLFAIGQLGTQAVLTYVSPSVPPPPASVRTALDVEVAIGGGYGRVLDVGSNLRVRRIAAALEAARALGRPIDPSLARRLQLAWWGLRGTRSQHPVLTRTVAILREAGVLLSEPDSGLTYELLQILSDGLLDRRMSGWEAYVAFGEGYLLREEDPVVDDGRVEQLLARASYGKQIGNGNTEISGTGFGRLRLFVEDGEASPWAVGATARYRRFAYSDYFDPLGALDVSASVGASDAGEDDSEVSVRLEGEVGFTLVLNRASGVRVFAGTAVDGGEVLLTAGLAATYGLADASFAGR